MNDVANHKITSGETDLTFKNLFAYNQTNLFFYRVNDLEKFSFISFLSHFF